MWGISVYAGLGMPEITAYIKKAARLGASKVLTSLHIPEASPELMDEFFSILETCAEQGLSLYADIEEKYYHTLPFERCPNLVLRLDFGFSDEEIADLAHKHLLVLNASILTEVQMVRLQALGLDWNKLFFCHNFYPRPETGLSLELFRQKNKMFAHLGVAIDAMIMGSRWKRPPLGEGLPTLERHRHCSPLTAAQECLALGATCILFGDMATDAELEQLALLEENKGRWVLPVDWIDNETSILKTMEHRNRSDPGDSFIRSELSRGVLKLPPTPNNCTARPKGAVTVDNTLYARYGGELNISAKDFPADGRVNVLGYVADGGLLTDYIGPLDSWIFTGK